MMDTLQPHTDLLQMTVVTIVQPICSRSLDIYDNLVYLRPLWPTKFKSLSHMHRVSPTTC